MANNGSTPFSQTPLGVILGLSASPITAAINGAYGSKAAAEAYDRQLDFWNKQNEYNDPRNARERLEKAGFNPMAAVQGISQSQAAGGLSSVAVNPAAGQIMGNPLEGLRTLAEVDNLRSHSSLLVQQAAKQFLQNLVEKWNLPAEVKKAIFRYINSDRINEAEIANTEADTHNKDASAGHHEAAAGLAAAQTETEDALRDKRVSELDAKIEELNSNVSINATRQSLMGSQIQVNDSLRSVYAAQRDYLLAQTDTERERAKNVLQDTVRLRIQNTLDMAYGAYDRYQRSYKLYCDAKTSGEEAKYAGALSKARAQLVSAQSFFESCRASLSYSDVAFEQSSLGSLSRIIGIFKGSKLSFILNSTDNPPKNEDLPPAWDIFSSESTY